MRLVNQKFFNQQTPYYVIFERNKEIGNISYKLKGHFLIIGLLEINKEYRKQGYGRKTIEFLIKKYPKKMLIGESLQSASKFWKKCIKDYDGKQYRINYSSNCVFSFVLNNIDKRKIEEDEIEECLKIGYNFS